MGFKIDLGKVDSEFYPEAVGEYLRRYFFANKTIRTRKPRKNSSSKVVDDYLDLNWVKGVEPLPPVPLDSEHNHPLDQEADDFCGACDAAGMVWVRGKKNNIECRYYGYDNGCLAFVFSDGSCIINDDHEDPSRWESYPEFPNNWY